MNSLAAQNEGLVGYSILKYVRNDSTPKCACKGSGGYPGTTIRQHGQQHCNVGEEMERRLAMVTIIAVWDGIGR